MAKEIVEEIVDELAKYKHPYNSGYYAFVVVPVAMLETDADKDGREAKKDIKYNEDGTEKSYKLKKTREYLTLYSISVDSTLALCLLNEKLKKRMKPVSREDMDFWDDKLKIYGIKKNETWLTIAEAKALMATPEWLGGPVEEEPVTDPVVDD